MSRRSCSAAAGFALSLLLPALAFAAMMPSTQTTKPSPQTGGTQERLGAPPAGDPNNPLTVVNLYDSGPPSTDPVGTTTWWSNYRASGTNYDHMARGFSVPGGSVVTSFRIWWAYGSEGTLFGCVNGGGTAADFSSITLDLYSDASGPSTVVNLPGTWTVLSAPTFYKEYTLTTPIVLTDPLYYVSLKAQTVSAIDYAATILWLNGASTGPEPDFGEFNNGCAGPTAWTNLSTFYGSDQQFGLQVFGYTNPNGVDAIDPVGCISLGNPCVEVDFDITRFEPTPMRGYSVTFTLSPNLTLCAGLGSITQGTYLSSLGGSTTTFAAISNGGGSYTADCAILGLPCGQTAATGNLFSVDVKNTGADGKGTVTVTSVTARDCANVPIAIGPGDAASVDIDNTAPGVVTSLAATQLTTGNDGDGTTKVDIAFTPPTDADLAEVKVYRAPYGTGTTTGSYPEYDDTVVSGPPAVPSYPPGGPWAPCTGVTTSGDDDETTDRGYWYYVAFALDDCGNVSPVSTMTGGTLNYHLGDWHNGTTDCQGNNVVSLPDLSFLGSNYGIAIVYLDPKNCLDVGPTTTAGVNGRPLTDNLINFEDLILFAINYGTVSFTGGTEIVELGQPGVGAVDLRLVPVNRAVKVGDRVEIPVVLTGKVSDVRGIRTVITYDAGLLSYEGSGVSEAVAGTEHFFKDLTLDGQVDLNLATLGTGIEGSGAVMWVRFRALKSGPLDLQLHDSYVRDSSNRELLAQAEVARNQPDQAAPMSSAVPAAYRLGDAVPNPFNPRTMISYDLPEATAVKLAIYDVTGRVVRTLVDSVQPAGSHAAEWDGTNDNGRHVESGIYFYAMRAGSFESQRRMALLK